MKRSDRVYQDPHYPLPEVQAAAKRDIVITGKAVREARVAYPADLIDLESELRETVRTLLPEEFQFAQRKPIREGVHSWVDVYRIDFEGCDIWLKLKIEHDAAGPHVVVISCHQWDEGIPI